MLGGQESLGREKSPCKVPGGLEKWRRPLWLEREGGDEDREVIGAGYAGPMGRGEDSVFLSE